MYHKQNHFIRTITYIAMCVALICVCAWITIPFPIPFTLQIFAVFLIAAVSDWRISFLSVLAYIGIGVLGVPVFSGFQAGPSVFFGISGGYLLGFLLAALFIGFMEKLFAHRRGMLWVILFLALLICYCFGVLWYRTVFLSPQDSSSVWQAIGICVLPFLLPDLIKITLVYVVANRLEPFLHKINCK
ncbi:MAG: biotin transporter BioY [Ruminococcaceae bacterium]|nr:biotin transporter BioY [Oscillospiraceae bacterium]